MTEPRDASHLRDRDASDIDDDRVDFDNDDVIDVVRTDVERVGDAPVDDPLQRAQPGDVLGIEHDGEVTNLGDTARDERERLRDEEEEAAKQRRDELKDRDRR